MGQRVKNESEPCPMKSCRATSVAKPVFWKPQTGKRLMLHLIRALAALFVFAAVPASAQPYPSKPITIVVPFARRQRHGLDHAHRRAVSAERTRPKRRGGEQGRRERRAGGDLRGARRARRLHAADGDELDALRQSAPVQVARLRSREGFRAGRAHRQLRVHAGGQQGRPGENAARAGRLREGQSRQAHLRERQHHRHRGGRDAEKPRRDRHPPRPLQEHAAGASTTCSAGASR